VTVPPDQGGRLPFASSLGELRRHRPAKWRLLGVLSLALGCTAPQPRPLAPTPEGVTEIHASAIGHGVLRVPLRRDAHVATVTLESAVWVKNPAGLADAIEFSCSLHDGTATYLSPGGQQGFVPATRPAWETLQTLDRQHVIVLLRYRDGWWLADRYEDTSLLPYAATDWRRVCELVERHRRLAADALSRPTSPTADACFARLCAVAADPEDRLGSRFVELGAEGIPTLLRALGDETPIGGLWLQVACGGCSATRWVASRSKLACALMERITGVGFHDLGSFDEREHALAAASFRALGAYALASPAGRIEGWPAR
jgi:hypothetical protein